MGVAVVTGGFDMAARASRAAGRRTHLGAAGSVRRAGHGREGRAVARAGAHCGRGLRLSCRGRWGRAR
jgi:hypothetical protein